MILRWVTFNGLEISLPEDAVGCSVNGRYYALSEDKLSLVPVCQMCGGSGELLGPYGESLERCPCKDPGAPPIPPG